MQFNEELSLVQTHDKQIHQRVVKFLIDASLQSHQALFISVKNSKNAKWNYKEENAYTKNYNREKKVWSQGK